MGIKDFNKKYDLNEIVKVTQFFVLQELLQVI